MSDTHSRYVARPYWYDGHKLDPSDLDLKAYVEEKVAEALAASQPGGGSGYLTATVELTDAQIKALNTVAVTLVAAQGAGTIIFPQSVYMRLIAPGGNGYGNIHASSQIVISVGLGVVPIYFLFDNSVNNTVEGFLDSGSETQHVYSGISMSTNADPVTVGMDGGIADPDVENTALSMYMNNSLGALSGGNAANTLKVTVCYVVVDL